jgi:hypothetical protein
MDRCGSESRSLISLCSPNSRRAPIAPGKTVHGNQTVLSAAGATSWGWEPSGTGYWVNRTAVLAAAGDGSGAGRVEDGASGTDQSRAGDHKLNRGLYMMAIVQIRHPTAGQAYYRRKLAEGKSSKEALRCLKRRLSDAVYRCLVADQHLHANRPGVGLAAAGLPHNCAPSATARTSFSNSA